MVLPLIVLFFLQISISLFIVYVWCIRKERNFEKKLNRARKRLKIFFFLIQPIFYEWVGIGIYCFLMGILRFDWFPYCFSFLCVFAFLVDPFIWKAVYKQKKINYTLSFLLNFTSLFFLIFYYLALFL